MHNKKAKNEMPPENKILEERVDAMMDPKKPDARVQFQEMPSKEKDGDKLPPLDIFSGATTAPPVPGELASEIPEEAEETIGSETSNDVSSNSEGQGLPTEPQLDDEVSDAAVDDIVAQESDTVLAAEDSAIREQKVHEPKPKKIHHHPIFWTLVTLVAIVAITSAILLVSGGNWHLPGPLQSAKNALSK